MQLMAALFSGGAIWQLEYSDLLKRWLLVRKFFVGQPGISEAIYST